MSQKKVLSKYERAKKRIAALRSFYNHILIYVIVNIGLFLLREKMTFVLLSKKAIGDPEFISWIDWNLFGTPIIWGVVLAIHGFSVYKKPLFGKVWEERQLRKFLDEDNGN